MNTDMLRKLAAKIRTQHELEKREKVANTARAASALLGLTHFKRILGIPIEGTK